MEAVKENTLLDDIEACESSQDRWKLLTTLSKQAKELIEVGAVEAETVNEVLIEIYTNDDHFEFNTFHQWKKKGYKVKKGSKAFFVWSTPKKITKKKSEKEKDVKDEEEEMKFRLAYLFSNAQVEPIKDKE